jgi:hypothetical protein
MGIVFLMELEVLQYSDRDFLILHRVQTILHLYQCEKMWHVMQAELPNKLAFGTCSEFDVKLSRRLKLINSSRADSRVNSLKRIRFNELTWLSAREEFINVLNWLKSVTCCVYLNFLPNKHISFVFYEAQFVLFTHSNELAGF